MKANIKYIAGIFTVFSAIIGILGKIMVVIADISIRYVPAITKLMTSIKEDPDYEDVRNRFIRVRSLVVLLLIEFGEITKSINSKGGFKEIEAISKDSKEIFKSLDSEVKIVGDVIKEFKKDFAAAGKETKEWFEEDENFELIFKK